MTNPNCLTPDRSPIVAGILRHLESHSHQTSRRISDRIEARLNTVETYMALLVKRKDAHISKWFPIRHPKGMTTWAAGYSKGSGTPAPDPRKTIACSGSSSIQVTHATYAPPIPLDPILAALGGFK